MHDPTNEKYFFWGAATTMQYGLYSPVLCRIILTDGSPDAIDRLEYVAFLLSAKIELFVVPLHQACNFRPNLVDNECCANWDIVDWPSEHKHFKAKYFRLQHDHRLQYCGRLISASGQYSDPDQLMRFAWLAYWLVDFFRFGPNVLYTKFHDLITMPFSGPDCTYRQIRRRERECFDMIYHGQSYAATEIDIERLIDVQLTEMLQEQL